ncbi:MAG: hypothetical protein BMS9Abin31_0662 [Gammaproteobacteria bacterium]|nr:MAG: hypothetical protein BMS9Abin31_0662 [Gammaproteobacteria bacterium]
MNITDIMIHVHPELSAEQRTKVEDEVSKQDGVISVHFSPKLQHELTVAYNPESLTSEAILSIIRQWDQDAVMVGL